MHLSMPQGGGRGRVSHGKLTRRASPWLGILTYLRPVLGKKLYLGVGIRHFLGAQGWGWLWLSWKCQIPLAMIDEYDELAREHRRIQFRLSLLSAEK